MPIKNNRKKKCSYVYFNLHVFGKERQRYPEISLLLISPWMHLYSLVSIPNICTLPSVQNMKCSSLQNTKLPSTTVIISFAENRNCIDRICLCFILKVVTCYQRGLFADIPRLRMLFLPVVEIFTFLGCYARKSAVTDVSVYLIGPIFKGP